MAGAVEVRERQLGRSADAAELQLPGIAPHSNRSAAVPSDIGVLKIIFSVEEEPSVEVLEVVHE